MKVQIQLDIRDWRKAQAFVIKDARRSLSSASKEFLISFAGSFLVAIALFSLFFSSNRFHIPTAIYVLILASLLGAYSQWQVYRIRKIVEPDETGVMLGTSEYDLTESGILAVTEGISASYSWKIIRKVRREQGMIMLYIDSTFLLIFPEHKLTSPDEFYDFICQHHTGDLSELRA